MVTIPVEHLLVHMGLVYSLDYTASLANGASLNIHIAVPKEYDLHTEFSVLVGGDGLLYMYEEPVLSNNGTLLTPVCQNRDFAVAMGTKFYHTPTVTSVGTALINGRIIPGGSGPQSVGHIARAGAEWLLGADKSYLVRVTNSSGNTQAYGLSFQVYERPEASQGEYSY